MKYNLKLNIFFLIFFSVFSLQPVYSVEGTPTLDVKKNQIEVERGHAKKEINKLRLLEKIESNRLYKNQQKLEYAQYSLQKNQKKYTDTKNEMTSIEKKLGNLLTDYKQYQVYTSKRIVQIFKHKRNNYIEFLLNSEDINTFLDRLYFENVILTYDKKKLRESKACAREILALRNKMQMNQKNLEASIAAINREKSDIQIAISKNEQLIKKLETDRATWERAEKDLAKQSRAISQMINKEIRKSQKEGVVSPNLQTAFARPVQGKITSPYGWRMHPVFKRKIFHSGIDIGAPYGTPIRAANYGRVIFVGWYSGYGKVIIIDHGTINGAQTTTLYAHMSTTIAKQGMNVKKGDVIGKVGTTGYSTGPHLHFEVRQKGNPTNPLNFVR